MKHALIIIFTCLLLFCYSCTSPSTQEKQIPINPHQQAFLQDYDAFLRTSKLPGMAVAIVKDTSIIFLKGYGLKAKGSRDSVDTNTVFRIGSLSKGFASVLAGLLAEEGQISWKDPLIKHLPKFQLKSPTQSKALTIEHILSHTSGLAYHTYTNLVEAGQTTEQIMKALSQISLNTDPAETYSYQNAIYSLIDPILANKTNQPYATLLQDRIFSPLHMQQASTSYEGIAEHSNKALPHRATSNSWQRVSLSKKYYNAIPAGGINASISDMGEWMLALLGNRPEVLSQRMLDDLFTPRIKTPIKSRYFRSWQEVEQSYYALGWRVLDYGSDTIIYHGGFVNSYRSEIAFNRKEKIGICILTNASSRFANKCIPEFFDRYAMRKDSIDGFIPLDKDN